MNDSSDTRAIPTVEEVLARPTEAEAFLHAALTVRALKWLDFLTKEEEDPARVPAGQRAVTLTLQVEMFKVLSAWLLASKKTKTDGDADEGAPGIEQMRALVEEALASMNAEAPKQRDGEEAPKQRNGFGGGPPQDPDKFIEAGRRGARVSKANAAARNDDDSELSILLNRARKRTYESDPDE